MNVYAPSRRGVRRQHRRNPGLVGIIAANPPKGSRRRRGRKRGLAPRPRFNPVKSSRGWKVSRGDLGPANRCVSCNRKPGQLHGANCQIALQAMTLGQLELAALKAFPSSPVQRAINVEIDVRRARGEKSWRPNGKRNPPGWFTVWVGRTLRGKFGSQGLAVAHARSEAHPGAKKWRGLSGAVVVKDATGRVVARFSRDLSEFEPRNPPTAGEGPGQNIRHALQILANIRGDLGPLLRVPEWTAVGEEVMRDIDAAIVRLRAALKQVEAGHLGNPGRGRGGRLLGVAHNLKYKHTTKGNRQHPFETTAHIYCMPGGAIEIRSPHGLPLWQEQR